MLSKIMLLSAIAGSMLVLTGCDEEMTYITQVPPPTASYSSVRYGEGPALASSSVTYIEPVSRHHHHRHHRTVIVPPVSNSSVHYGEAAPVPTVIPPQPTSGSSVHYGEATPPKPESGSSVHYGEPEPVVSSASNSSVHYGEDNNVQPQITEVKPSGSSVRYGG